MAHDDMNVVMYKILAYLYDCQRRGEEPQRSMLAHDGSMLAIPHNYWADVLEELADGGNVRGVRVTKDMTGGRMVDMRDPKVTLAGVDFLQENSAMRRALRMRRHPPSPSSRHVPVVRRLTRP